MKPLSRREIGILTLLRNSQKGMTSRAVAQAMPEWAMGTVKASIYKLKRQGLITGPYMSELWTELYAVTEEGIALLTGGQHGKNV